jgi:hypothetical protein
VFLLQFVLSTGKGRIFLDLNIGAPKFFCFVCCPERKKEKIKKERKEKKERKKEGKKVSK